ncbi:MAG: class I SAM-dependent methyltransferase [Actinomycetota bacterium]|jgi:16S rRNA (guanine527-N7)-methyltransferase|nr:class I SAM-dependent methyltransferase [Actinomycetota bacterium]MDA3015007.1 class I SAM-dependent methyltransferase [Actinomycetota bacterium]MDA3028836.1 class I SAM-dependent methyltransferase [Actinomycetota bacterium]
MDSAPDHTGRDDGALLEALGIAQRLGVIGDTDLVAEIAHARGYVAALTDLSTGGWVLDIGSGGGLPGLVIAHDRPDLLVTLVDRREKRTDILRRQVGRLSAAKPSVTATVVCAEVADISRPERGFDAITARSFGPPEVTAKLAAPLLTLGGLLVVSDPPDTEASTRWTDELLNQNFLERSIAPTGHRISVLRRAS